MIWVKGKYRDSIVQNKAVITTLHPIATNGRYNIFKCHNGKYVVIFSDQPDLLHFAMENTGSLFAIKLIDPSNQLHKYTVEVEQHGVLEVYTVARLSVLIQNHQQTPIKLYVVEDTPVIESPHNL